MSAKVTYGQTQAMLDAKYGYYLNVKDQKYGAKGDGTTDDTSAIQAAITAAPAGSVIYFPPGTYVVSSTLSVTIRLKIMGAGAGKTFIKPTALATGPVLSYNMGSSTQNCVVEGIQFDLSLATTLTAVAINNWGSGSQLRDCRVNSGAVGISITNTSGSYFHHITMSDLTDAGIRFQGDGGTDCSFSETVISRDTTGTLTTGFDYVRTTTGVTQGGLFFNKFEVINPGGTVTYGYSFVSTAGSYTQIYLFMNQSVADNINGTAAMRFVNVGIVNIVNSFICSSSSSIPAVSISGGVHYQFVGNYFVGGIIFPSAPDSLIFSSNKFSSGVTAFLMSSGAPTNLILMGNLALGTFTDNQATLSAALLAATTGPLNLVVAQSANAIDITPDAGTQSKQAYMRVNQRARFGYDGVEVIIDDNGQSKDVLLRTSSTDRMRILSGGGVKMNNGLTWTTGTGAPTIAGTAGDRFSRTDTPTVSNQREYVCTVTGGAGVATWVGIL